MPIETSQKVAATHLKRDAFLYVRQSSLRQVMENTESTKRQYALRERAIALGWPSERIHVIDDDTGKSGASADNRDGFQRLMSEVAIGNVGIVLGLEVSRFARNSVDWHRLLELAALSKTLILDEDGVYDPTHFNDRLLLGLKGTMSEAELHVLKARLQGGILNKARRGELKIAPPIGLVYREDDSLVLDPDQQIQKTIRLLFETFEREGSAMAVVKRFNKENLLFPKRIRRGIGKGELHWIELEHTRVLQILHNPRYAGAFVYGRRCSRFNPELKAKRVQSKREDWQVLIPNAHVGYTTWETFERNQTRLRNNLPSFGVSGRGTVSREGPALLQGRLLCGFCGKRMRVRYYSQKKQLIPHYICSEATVRKGKKSCQSVSGKHIDAAISQLVQSAVSPSAIETALAVQQEITARLQQAEALRHQQLERARYEAELARRRYLKVDPDNRFVADTLEADWNKKLREVDQLQQMHEQERKAERPGCTEALSKKLVDIVKNFHLIWDNPNVSALERKKVIAYLLEDVTLIKRDKITLHIRFKGGKTQTLLVPCPVLVTRIRKTRPEIIKALDKIFETHTDQEAALELNKRGYRNWRGDLFTHKKIGFIRKAYGLKGRFVRLHERGFLTGKEMAKKLNVSIGTICTWCRDGLLTKALYGKKDQCLYKLNESSIIVKGQGGTLPKPPKVITVKTTE